ncbi:MAG: CheR family methyltransferase [Nitrospirota bacterium]
MKKEIRGDDRPLCTERDHLPFSKLDMISCRNLLIYMNTKLQRKVLSVFHYALNRAFYHTFHISKGETEGVLVNALGERLWNIGKLKELLEKVLPEKSRIENFEVEHDIPKIGKKKMLINAQQIDQA